MTSSEQRQIEALEQRMSNLSAAILSINENLDLDTVLRNITECACSLTAASRGVITTVDEKEKVLKFVSNGFSAEEHERIETLGDSPRLFAPLREIPESIRRTNLSAWARELGFTADGLPSISGIGMPLRLSGRYLGSCFVGEKVDGSEFTKEDEEILRMFGTQAAAIVANAYSYEAEQRARSDLEDLIDLSPIGVTVIDAHSGVARSCNREVRRMFEKLYSPGDPLEHVSGEMICRFEDGREISLDQRSIQKVFAESKAVRAEEIEFVTPDGRSTKALVNVTPIQSEYDDEETIVVTLQELNPVEGVELKRAAFLDMVSHELRTPLTAITGSAVTLEGIVSSIDQPEANTLLGIITEQTAHLRDLVGDLLDAGSFDAGRFAVSPEPSEVSALVERARDTFTSGARVHEITIDLAPDLPPVMADRRRIRQVLTNLLMNAARNSPESKYIGISASRVDSYVEIAVRDEGRGIEADRLPQLFSLHTRTDDDGTGKGLGLVIAKGLVESHGGQIRAESEGLGQGACFTFTVPIAEEPEYAVLGASEQLRTIRDDGNSARVLVVDDDPLALRFIREALSEAGYTVLGTADHRELSHLIKKESPDLVLLDVMFPDSDGIELLQRNSDLASLPVIFISGYGRDSTIARALENGAADYIVKPIEPKELVARIQVALRERDSSGSYD